MIERRMMTLVEGSHNISPIIAMYDTEKNKVICYQFYNEGMVESEEDWLHLYPKDIIFSTTEEAREYVAKRQEYLRNKMPEIKEYIEEMRDIDKENFNFDEKDYLGFYAPKKERERTYYKDYKYYLGVSDLLTNIARSRRFNINGETIDIDEVVRVVWNRNYKATLQMRNGHSIRTNSKEECEVVERVFGSNLSEIEKESNV